MSITTAADITQANARGFVGYIQEMQAQTTAALIQTAQTAIACANITARVVHDVALRVFHTVNEILKNVDPTNNAIKLVASAIELCKMAGIQGMGLFDGAVASLKTVSSFVSAKSIFQKFDALTNGQEPITADEEGVTNAMRLTSKGAFAVADGLGLAKWCADTRLIGSRWYHQPVSVLGKRLPVTPGTIQTAAAVAGFATSIAADFHKAWREGGLTVKSSLSLASNIARLAAVILFQVPNTACTALATVANSVGCMASLTSFIREHSALPAPAPKAA